MLTSAQLTTLKNDIAANTNTINGVQIKDMPVNDDTSFAIAGWYNQAAAGPYKVWGNAVALKDIRAAADLGKYTPTDNPPASGGTQQITNDQLLYNNRALQCQLKQGNAFFLIQGEGSVDCATNAFRLLFSDCMTGIPSGASGANQNAGWGTSGAPGAVRLAMQRNATNIEKLFSTQPVNSGNAGNVNVDGRGVATNPDALVVVGPVSGQEVSQARAT
jgi:hypothetical protein